MKIDSSRYVMFWTNPDRYRLRECWKLAPVEPKPESFAGLMTFGRRRGTAFHDLREFAFQGLTQEDAIAKVKEKKDVLGESAIAAAVRMDSAVRDAYPNETYLAHEALFEYPIPDSPHSMVGRIDHILPRDSENPQVGDWKTSKRRTKKDFAALCAKYVGSPQVGFYLLGARTLGFETGRFLYRVVQDSARNKSARAEIAEHIATRTSLELKQLERSVHLTCELITYLKTEYGTVKPWPVLFEPFDRGYSTMLGQQMYPDFMPDGFQPKVEHLENMEDEPEAEDAE